MPVGIAERNQTNKSRKENSMSRKQHDKQINGLQKRHVAVIKKLGGLEPANLVSWRHPWITTPAQLKLLTSMIEQLEATELVARAAALNLNQTLGVIIEDNMRGQ
jgi:hypothetical protein